MQVIYEYIIGTGVLVFGLLLGWLLAKVTREELPQSQFWFKVIILFSSVGAIVFLILKNDALFFTFLFISVVTGMSLKPFRKEFFAHKPLQKAPGKNSKA